MAGELIIGYLSFVFVCTSHLDQRKTLVGLKRCTPAVPAGGHNTFILNPGDAVQSSQAMNMLCNMGIHEVRHVDV